jgi:hypothetical protein
MNNLVVRTGIVAVLLTAALAGCGGGSSGGAGGATPHAASTNVADQELGFTQCLRQHGVNIADPKPGEGVKIQVNPQNEAVMTAAQKACEAFAPKGATSGPQASADLDRQVKLTQCLRQHGVQVPDPKPGQPFTMRLGPGQNRQQTQAAMQACQQKIMGTAP